MQPFFAHGEFDDFKCTDCHFVSGLSINIQVSSQLLIPTNLVHSECTAKGQNRFPFEVLFVWSIALLEPLAHRLFMFNLSVKMHRTLSRSKLTILAIAQTHNLWSFQITSCTFSMLWPVTNVCVDDLSDHQFDTFPALQKSSVPFQNLWMTHTNFSVSLSP